MKEATRVTEKGQATIPEHLCEKYNLYPGDEVVWLDTDDGIVVRKRTQSGGRDVLAPNADTDDRDATGEVVGDQTRHQLSGTSRRTFTG